jgi:hypothetical protein
MKPIGEIFVQKRVKKKKEKKCKVRKHNRKGREGEVIFCLKRGKKKGRGGEQKWAQT